MATAFQHISRALADLTTQVSARENSDRLRFQAMLDRVISLSTGQVSGANPNDIELPEEFFKEFASTGDE